jgi:hypothetical protein
MSEEITKLNEKIKNYGETIKKLHGINEINKTKFNEELNQVKDQLGKKEEECRALTEKVKSLEKKNEDIYKNVTSGNISDINEIRKSFEKEKIIQTELIKTYKAALDEKSDSLQTFQAEIQQLRLELDEEKKKNESLLLMNSSKYDLKSQEMQFFKVSTENSSLKTKLLMAEDKIEKLNDSLEKANSQKNEIEKLSNDSLTLMKKELGIKNSSYVKLLKDYQNTLSLLSHTQTDLEKAKYFNSKYEKDNLSLEKNVNSLENENIDLKAEKQGLLTKIKGNESELETNRKKVQEYENKLAEYKLSKQVFEVTYIYLRMALEGRITFQREGDQYFVMIHNRTATRRYTFLELEFIKDNFERNKFIIKFLKENNQEEYFCNDLPRLLEYYEEYRIKIVESNDFSNKNKLEISNSEKKKMRVEKQLQDMFDI